MVKGGYHHGYQVAPIMVKGSYLISLGQYGNRGGACVQPAASFSGGHPLHSVDAALILEAAIHPLSTDGGASKLAAALLFCGCYLHHLNRYMHCIVGESPAVCSLLGDMDSLNKMLCFL